MRGARNWFDYIAVVRRNALIVIPAASGPLECILGYDDPADYRSDPYYAGVTGEIAAVDDSFFDLRVMAELASRAYDHNFVPEGVPGEIRVLAKLFSPDSGVGLSVHSTQAALQVYTGDLLNTPFIPRHGIALEAQHYPDAPNQKDFPSARLLPGETYRQQTIYEFTLPGD